jgi:arylsulfatase A-like enzyme
MVRRSLWSVLLVGTLLVASLGVSAGRGAPAVAAADPITFRAAASVGGAGSSRPTVTIPTSVVAGDTLLLFVSNGSAFTPSIPAGWTPVDTRVDSELRTDVFVKAAVAADAGASVSVELRNSSGEVKSATNTITVSAYAGVLSPSIAAFAATVETRSTVAFDHTTPPVQVPTDGAWVVSYWADRTSNTTTTRATTRWIPPAGQQSRATAYNTNSGGRVTSLLTDDGAPASAGPRSGLTAIADGQTFKATLWSIVLNGTQGEPGPPTAAFDYTCVALSCTFDARTSSTPSGTIVDYAWDFGDQTQGSGSPVAHSYTAPGSYPVALTVTDSRGETDQVTRTVTAAEPPPPGSRPNILVINTDDQRYPETLDVMPQVQSWFGEGGTTFVNGGVTTALCCPSRSSLFSGRYSHNTGITGNGLTDLVAAFDQDATIQGYLQAAGYNTAIVGKFLNTYPLNRNPLNWNRWAVFTGGYNDVPFNIDGSVRSTTGYYSHRMGDYAVQFLRGFEGEDDKPWFLYLAPQAPHSGFVPETKYADAPVPAAVKPPSWNEADVSDKPGPVRWRSLVSESSYQSRRTQMLRTLMSVDDLAGRVITELQALGEESDTLAVYTSDNGYLWAEHRILDKRFPYMESVEVPYLVRWPGQIEAGVTSTRLVLQIDLLPTFLEAAGAQPTLTYPLDGQPLQSSPPRDEILYEYFKSPDAPLGPWASLRGRDWQYVEWYDVTTGAITFREYYDLATDPYQLVNLLADGNQANDPDVSTLHDRLTAARSCVGAACP